ncbi:PREDICTED: L-type lectin-domain containing receptor kinase S.4-like [Tarenaya hassleriana]|uniref:L-type lectin-domain containing receptor kinase S.4-like n=1 Tax=Tarenaya hassleriana TaxID=28532 RepID=UPI00053C9B28|nr:PREDICTED: L-type lectin-domain containing receptor kinase S.4-like [Tarenaya hassleriana]
MKIDIFSNLFQIIFIFHFLFVISPSSQSTTELFFEGFKNADPSNLTLSGVAEIQPNGLLRLTNQTSRLLGHCFYSSPIQFKNHRNGAVFSFSTTFAFAVVPQFPTLGGHGLSFAVSPAADLPGATPSNYLGLFNSSTDGNFTNHLLAVEFDTVQDFLFQDINDNHVGIDINSVVSDKSVFAGYFDDEHNHTWRNISLQDGKPVFAWIDYDSGTNLLNVTLSTNSRKPRSPILSYRINLAPILHDKMYVGFAASTGLLASSHYVMGWSFKINGEAKNLDLSSLPSITGSKKNSTGLIVGVSASATVLAISAVIASVALFLRFKNRDVIEDWEFEIGPHRYSYTELKKATRNFSESELLGRGGFGQVFRGTLPGSNIRVAVKRVSHESKQGLREFVSEIASIGRLRHRNLAQLLGWCRRRGDLLLVYEFMPHGSLDKFLFNERPQIELSWDQRFKIIKDVASALFYLHEGYEQVVLHRDVKASNVLLDGDLTGRLGDFGLARLYDHGTNPGTTRVVGTLGYLAPEVPRTGKFTTSSDVYAFGMLLLEVVTGRRPIEMKTGPDDLVLADWVWDRFKTGRVAEIVDPKLGNRYDESEVLLVVKLGLMCSDNVPTSRPTMRQAVRYLRREIDTPRNLDNPEHTYGESKANINRFDGFEGFYGSTSFGQSNSRHRYSYTGTGFASSDSISTSPVSLLRETM